MSGRQGINGFFNTMVGRFYYRNLYQGSPDAKALRAAQMCRYGTTYASVNDTV